MVLPPFLTPLKREGEKIETETDGMGGGGERGGNRQREEVSTELNYVDIHNRG